MEGFINGYDFLNAEAQKYWSFPSSYNTTKRVNELNRMLYSDDYVASEKRDGYFQFIIKDEDGNVFMRARSKGVNGWVCKQDWVPHITSFFDALPNGTCLVSEIYFPGKTSKAITTILGCAKDKAIERQKENKLRLSIFDVLSYEGELLYSCPITDRIEVLYNIRDDYQHPYVDYVTYWDNPDDIHENWLDILSAGGEGVVLTLKNNPYEFGKRTAHHTLKLKKELSENIDVFLTGRYKEATYGYTGGDIENWPYWYNEITEQRVFGKLCDRLSNDGCIPVTRLWYNKMAGAVEIATHIKGKIVPIGWISGISDDIRAGIVGNPQSYYGKVAELQAMEADTTSEIPTLRHAKILRWRDDKNMEDCVWQ